MVWAERLLQVRNPLAAPSLKRAGRSRKRTGTLARQRRQHVPYLVPLGLIEDTAVVRAYHEIWILMGCTSDALWVEDLARERRNHEVHLVSDRLQPFHHPMDSILIPGARRKRQYVADGESSGSRELCGISVLGVSC